MSSCIGKNIKISLFGESHGPMIGVTIDGLKPGIKLDMEYIYNELEKRKSLSNISTPRKEKDAFEIVSGYYNGYTTGTPLTIIVRNENTKSRDYQPTILRPGHADYTAYLKYNGYQDYRGGGHFSGRLTVGIVIAGAICKQILESKGILIGSHIKQIYNVFDNEYSYDSIQLEKEIKEMNQSLFPVLNESKKDEMIKVIEGAKSNKDSVGGIIETAVINLEGGIGEPFFESIESVLSSLVFSIPAVKGIEFGKGFAFSNMYGSIANDNFYCDENIKTKTNNNGGINGGISNGMPITFKTVIKPTPSIAQQQETVDIQTNENTTIEIVGRHDPCIVHRARVVIDSMTAIGLLDLIVQRYGYQWM